MRQTLNFKIYQDLYNKIRSHFYKPGEQLPTESALAERYNTSPENDQPYRHGQQSK